MGEEGGGGGVAGEGWREVRGGKGAGGAESLPGRAGARVSDGVEDEGLGPWAKGLK